MFVAGTFIAAVFFYGGRELITKWLNPRELSEPEAIRFSKKISILWWFVMILCIIVFCAFVAA